MIMNKDIPSYDWRSEALRSLVPGAQFSSGGSAGDLYWPLDKNNNVPCPSKEEIEAEITRLKSEYTSQEYARNRQEDYPDWGDQLNKIYDDGLTKWKSEMVDPIKAKWPKDNSGPV